MSEQPKPQVVSSAKDFFLRRKKRDEAVAVELPSGLVVSLKRPSVDKLIRDGHIPSDLAVSLQKASGGAGLKGGDLEKYYQVTDLITVHSVVEPKVLKGDKELTEEQYEAGYISLNDIEDTDKAFIMEYVQTGVANLKSFRPQQQG
jgi:hypothetical protein